jgi:glycosyltransferase involved in cell wall biosynthesis
MAVVSVIIPNYNHGPYLKQRIDSVLNQTWQDFEVMILDDCSTDNSRAVIEEYRGHPKVKQIIFNEVNSGGPFNQWKKGIEQSSGEYIWIAESDDWCESTLLQSLVVGLQNNDQCVLAYAQTYTINGSNIIEKTSWHDKLSEYVAGKKYIEQYLAESCSIWNASMMVFRRENYFNVSQRFTTFKMCGDWLFYIEMARQGQVFISGRVLNYFRNHDKDVSGKMYSSGNNYLEELKILRVLKDDAFINIKQFRTILLAKYISFSVFKYKFTDTVKQEIVASFNGKEGEYRAFLTFNGKFSLFKIKLKRRINLLLK